MLKKFIRFTTLSSQLVIAAALVMDADPASAGRRKRGKRPVAAAHVTKPSPTKRVSAGAEDNSKNSPKANKAKKARKKKSKQSSSDSPAQTDRVQSNKPVKVPAGFQKLLRDRNPAKAQASAALLVAGGAPSNALVAPAGDDQAAFAAHQVSMAPVLSSLLRDDSVLPASGTPAKFALPTEKPAKDGFATLSRGSQHVRDIAAIFEDDHNVEPTTHGVQPFNPAQYLANYPDLAGAVGAMTEDQAHSWALAHYLEYGRHEGRTYEAPQPSVVVPGDFNAAQYLINYPDLAQCVVGMTEGQAYSWAYHHFDNHGQDEGRTDQKIDN